MHDPPKNFSSYHKSLHESLENAFLRKTLDKFAVDYRASRAAIFQDVPERELIAKIAEAKDRSCQRLDELFQQFKREAEKRGAQVHFAKTAAEANEIIARIARENKVKKIVKSKSMTAEETLLNHRLEKDGLSIAETDLGEWIIQLRNEPPSHMVMPAIHLSRDEVAEDFSRATNEKHTNDIGKLVKVSRRELRRKFIEADMGISGANFAIAETGTIAIVTNEGNGRLVNTLPRVHVALIGLDKLTPTLEEALTALLVLPRNATSQRLTSYVAWIGGAASATGAEGGQRQVHFVFLDNGRSALAKEPLFSQVLRCVRCGACANVCPVYRLVGGHKMGHIYIGAIGIILSYFFFGRDKARVLAQNCVGCEACSDICAGGIELPRLIREIRARLNDENGAPMVESLISSVMKNRALFHTLLKFAKFAQRPVTGGTPFIRHLPQMFAGEHGFKALPALASASFRERWAEIRPRVPEPRRRVALFAGCAQDFIYPEQLEAAVKLLAAHNVEVDFPPEQSCCGLPLEAMGQRAVATDLAHRNAKAFDLSRYEAVVTLCASCASHIRHAYPNISRKGQAALMRSFSEKVTDFSSFARYALGLSAEHFSGQGQKVSYHASCHLCRGLRIKDAPRALIRASAEYVPVAEEELCCGFGGGYSVKFPEISAQLLDKKLEHYAAAGASRLVVDCPGCIMQLRGGATRKGLDLAVTHIAELLAENMKG
ncbi:MAG: LUD domain-containing protein [Candidatus Adiutrix sp.]|jgi:iron-sulfur cluster protein|nr:LUD domain-containing protein [Candidatus Adiutrix sp.]